MDEFRTSEQLEQASRQAKPEKKEYTPRPKSQVILAWVLVVVVILAFLGTCYWMIFGKF